MPFAEMFETVKQELILSINTIQMNIRKFSSSFDSLGGNSAHDQNMTDLIKKLCEGFMESCMSYNFALEKDFNRKITSL